VEAQGGNDDQDLDNQWQLLAEDYYRDLITAVTGSGDILGAVQYGATKYAFRSDGSNTVMYKSSASGWTAVTFFHLLRFDSGVTGADADLVPGATIDGQSSGATATIKSIVQNAGAWDGTAAGYMVVDVTSGTFQDAENIRVGGVNKCVADGANSAITLSPGGKFQFVEHNYYGSSDTSYLYGCDGVNFAWEFDGEVLTPILFPGSTNPSYNTPKYIEAHTTHLFLSFPGGRLAHSSLGTPLVFSGLMAAAAFGLGAECTGLESRAGQVLAIYTQDGKTYGLYGTDVTNWDMKVISESFGGKDYTVRSLGTVFAIDDQGIVPLERVQAYGDFEGATVSRSVRPILDQYSDSIVQAFTAKDRNQYRVAFSDGTILVMSDDRAVGGSNYAFSTLQYPDIPTCFSDNSDESGNQVILFGDSSGFVYQAEKGYTFDGDELESVCKLAFIHANSPSNEKRWHKVYTNIEAEWPISTMKIKWETNYATPHKPIFAGVTPDIKGGGGYFDVDNFDQIYFDAEQFSSAYNRLSGR
ncbi:MAG TPA: hypothetical protein DCZ12_17185, partial [Gammaproteobacteria bacterium]|nr:hypothetical protein [Gammaproteobacteria bacterium]